MPSSRKRRYSHIALASLLLLLSFVWGAWGRGGNVSAQVEAGATITPRLQALLVNAAEGEGKFEFVVVLTSQVDAAAVAETAASRAGAAGGEESVHVRGAAIYHALLGEAQRTQAPLRAWLDARDITYRPYYIRNMILVEGDAALVEALSKRPEVALLAANEASVLLEPNVPVEASDLLGAGASPPWGLDFIHAPDVWAQGHTGEGIVVASQDTGVQWNHPALQGAYRGWDAETETADHPYNWFDAFGLDATRQAQCTGEAATNAQIPCDDHGHGTHTVGTMVGDASSSGGMVIGVAPGAKWIGCRNMAQGVGSPTSYADCFQFFLAPYPQGGDPFTDGVPELAPHIINNSWGCPVREGCDDPNILRSVVETARAAGQFVVSSAGNNGALGCSSVSNPIAIYDAVFSIGALDSSGNLAGYSSRGPVIVDGSNRIKPDLSAPGSGVYSAYPNNNYTYLSGTSMASPHVAGAIALLWSAQPELIGDIDGTEDILRAAALPVEYQNCGGSTAAGGEIPANNGYGAGQLNILAAVQLALNEGPSLRVTVIDPDGDPLPDTQVNVVNLTSSATYSATTNSAGIAFFGTLLTRDWQGTRSMTYVKDQSTTPLIYVDVPRPIFAPLLMCSRADCREFTNGRALADASPFAGVVPFVPNPEN